MIRRLQRLFVSGLILFLLPGCTVLKEPQGPKPEVSIGYLICGGHLPLAVVQALYQKDLSFNLKLVQQQSWDKVVSDIRSGKTIGAFMLSPLAMNLIRENFPAKIVLKADRGGDSFILSMKIKSIEELSNHSPIIAVPHLYSQQNVILHKLLKQHHISMDKIQIIVMPPREMIYSLRQGEIDGFVVGEPEGYKAVLMRVGWMAAVSSQIWKGHMDHVFLASHTFIQEHSDHLQELINAIVQAGKFIETNPHKAAIMGEEFTGSNVKVFEEILTTPDWIDFFDMVPAEKDIQEMSDQLVEMGLWKSIPENLTTFTNLIFVNQATHSSTTRSSYESGNLH